MNDSSVATIGDVKRIVRDFTTVRFDSIDRRFDHMDEDIDRVLQIVISMDNRLKDSLQTLVHHEARITHLEQANGLIAA